MPETIFGKTHDKCKACGLALDFAPASREMSINIRHTATGAILAKLRYSPPLCRDCLVDGCLNVEVEWKGSPE
jgi:hypothetical protein